MRQPSTVRYCAMLGYNGGEGEGEGEVESDDNASDAGIRGCLVRV